MFILTEEFITLMLYVCVFCFMFNYKGVVNQDITVGGWEKNYFELRELNQEVSPPIPKGASRKE